MFKALTAGICCIAAVLLTACDSAPLPVTTVSDLMEDPVTLDSVLMKCNRNVKAPRSAVECRNARTAVERIAGIRETQESAKKAADFERNRDRLRMQQEAERRQQEAAKKVDPYSLPLVPPVPPKDSVAQTAGMQ